MTCPHLFINFSNVNIVASNDAIPFFRFRRTPFDVNSGRIDCGNFNILRISRH